MDGGFLRARCGGDTSQRACPIVEFDLILLDEPDGGPPFALEAATAVHPLANENRLVKSA